MPGKATELKKKETLQVHSIHVIVRGLGLKKYSQTMSELDYSLIVSIAKWSSIARLN